MYVRMYIASLYPAAPGWPHNLIVLQPRPGFVQHYNNNYYNDFAIDTHITYVASCYTDNYKLWPHPKTMTLGCSYQSEFLG